jgi:hypothetical protein
MRVNLWISWVLLAGVPAPVAAQVLEREAILEVLTRLFDGMRTRDTALMRSLFVPDAQLVNVAVRDGVPALNTIGVSAFLSSIAGVPAGVVLDERFYDPEVRVDGRVAMVWTTYDLIAGGRWSHCGVDAFILAHLADGWKITHLADTRRREGCTTPAAPR